MLTLILGLGARMHISAGTEDRAFDDANRKVLNFRSIHHSLIRYILTKVRARVYWLSRIQFCLFQYRGSA
jgi:hypothetical protein